LLVTDAEIFLVSLQVELEKDEWHLMSVIEDGILTHKIELIEDIWKFRAVDGSFYWRDSNGKTSEEYPFLSDIKRRVNEA
jgi:hypothetical protein